MRDFIKWLGVNEKIAKVVVWVFIILVMLIIVNESLNSLGLPYYRITTDNLKQINVHILLNLLSNWIVVYLTFCSMLFMVFRVKNFKKILPFTIIYLIANIFINRFTNGAITHAFTLVYFLTFCFLFSNKNWKYIVYGLGSLFINSIVQGAMYTYKAKFLDYSSLNYITKNLLSIDYFIIMGIIILVKEIYLKKRRDSLCGEAKVGYGGANSTKKEKSLKN